MKRINRVSLKSLKRRLRGIFFCVIVCFCLVPIPVYGAKKIPSPGNLYALSAAVLDGDSGRLLYGKEENVKRANASTTKILTCILCLENAELQDMICVSSYAAAMPDVQLHIKEGEWYRMEDLLYSLMLESHNDTAVALAEGVGGSVERFAKMMNEKAREIGCEQSYFITPNGLDEKENGKEHGTTAEELAKIMKYCAWDSPKRGEFLKITQTSTYTFTDYVKSEKEEYVKGERSFSCSNHNAYLTQNNNCISGKTGFTSQAGYCYVGAIESEKKKYVISLLGCGWPNNKNYKWEDCNQLFQYIEENYHYRTLPDVSGKLDTVDIKDAANDQFRLGQTIKVKPIFLTNRKEILLGDWEEINIQLEFQRQVKANKKGLQSIGNGKLLIGNDIMEESEIQIKSPFSKRTLDWYFKAICNLWMFG